MLTNGIQVQRYCRASAGRAGLSVVFEDINQPRHDGKTIYLPEIKRSTTDAQLIEFMASVDHEVAHDRFSSFDILKEKSLEKDSALAFVWNFLEDSRVNAIEAREYRGFRENWDTSTSSITTQILARAAKNPTSKMGILVTALVCWEAPINASMFPLIEMAASKFVARKDVLDVLSNFSDRLVDCQNILDKRVGSTATYDLAVDICKKLAEDSPSVRKDKTKGKDKSEGDKDGEESAAGEPAGTNSKTGEEPSETGEGEDKAPSEDDSRTDEFRIIEVVLTEDDLKDYSVTKPRDPTKMSNTGINHDPVAIDKGSWKLTDYSLFCVVDYPNNIAERKYLDSVNPHWVDVYKSRVGSKIIAQENFAQQVRKLIQIRAKVQTEYGVRKGKLDQARLSRICFNAPGLNEKVFKRKIENKTLDAAISVLVDMSGSMGGDKAYNAVGATVLLNEVCSTLGIPLEITGFSDEFSSSAGDYVPQMFIFKNFSNLRVTTDDLVRYFSKASRFMSGNPDGENILWSYDRLLKRKEKKRLFIVMSDGEPCASGSTLGVEKFTLQVIQEIEKAKLVDIYGLGLCSTTVTKYYKHNSVVNMPEEIPNKLLELIEKRLLT